MHNYSHQRRRTPVVLATFITTWDTTQPGTSAANQITLPLTASTTYPVTVDWGDGSQNVITSAVDPNMTHTYAAITNPTVTMLGLVDGWSFNNAGDRQKITDITDWGGFDAANSNGHFHGCSNLTGVSAAASNFIGTATQVPNMFRACGFVTPPDTSLLVMNAVQNLNGMFADNVSMTSAPLTGTWTTSALVDAGAVFSNCPLMATAPNTTNWSMGLVTTTNSMFFNCRVMPIPDTSNWIMLSLQNAQNMFFDCRAFVLPPDTSGWVMPLLTTSRGMFRRCFALTTPPDTTTWGMQSLTTALGMFFQCLAMTTPPNVLNWDVANLQVTQSMFFSCGLMATAADTSLWVTTSLQDTSSMYNSCPLITTAPVDGFDITNLTNASDMFTNLTLTTANYNAILAAWGAQTVAGGGAGVNAGVTFGANNAVYNLAPDPGGVGHDLLTAAVPGWTIVDGGGI